VKKDTQGQGPLSAIENTSPGPRHSTNSSLKGESITGIWENWSIFKSNQSQYNAWTQLCLTIALRHMSSVIALVHLNAKAQISWECK